MQIHTIVNLINFNVFVYIGLVISVRGFMVVNSIHSRNYTSAYSPQFTEVQSPSYSAPLPLISKEKEGDNKALKVVGAAIFMACVAYMFRGKFSKNLNLGEDASMMAQKTAGKHLPPVKVEPPKIAAPGVNAHAIGAAPVKTQAVKAPIAEPVSPTPVLETPSSLAVKPKDVTISSAASNPVDVPVVAKPIAENGKKINNVIGKTYVTHPKTGERISAVIKKSIYKFGNETYTETYTLTSENGQNLGKIKLKILVNKEAFDNDRMLLSFMTRYGKNNEKYLDRVYIDMMENTSGYKGVGNRLHQLAVERSMELGFSGRVQIEASWNSHGFHYKNGFRALNDDTNSNIQAILEKSLKTGIEPDTTGLGCVQMYLSDEGITAMQKKIADTRVLTQSS